MISRRKFPRKLIDSLFHEFCHIHHIPGRDCRNGDTDSRFSIDPHNVRRWHLISLTDFSNISQPKMFTTSGNDRQIPNIIKRIKIPCGFNTNTIHSRFYSPGIHHSILSFESMYNIRCRNTTLRHDGGAYSYFDRRHLYAINFHFGYIFDF